VHKQVPSAAARLDQFLSASGVGPNERVTVISDDAGELGKAVEGSQLARGRILDWFHIAMKFKAAENSVFGSATIEPLERGAVETEIAHAKWLVWHGKGGKSVARIKALDASLLARQGYECSTLWWNLRRLYFYIRYWTAAPPAARVRSYRSRLRDRPRGHRLSAANPPPGGLHHRCVRSYVRLRVGRQRSSIRRHPRRSAIVRPSRRSAC
jgi:hypothetical protein